MPSEAQIRDYLTKNIEALEPGLQVIQKEFPLPNAAGARGFVDILARDRFGHLVVIELKRSDQTGRAALHELHKYVALLKSAHGIEPHKIRCMVCSTHWHELLVPFSEYARTVEYSVEGREIEIGTGGLPVAFRPVTLCAEQHGLQLCPRHAILFYTPDEGPERRAAAAKLVAQNLDVLGTNDYLLLLLRNDANAALGISTHAVYVAIAQLGSQEKERLASNPDVQPIEGDGEEESEDTRWRWEEAAIQHATLHVPRFDFEIGYPEKLAAMATDSGWKVDGFIRGGRFRSEAIAPDHHLLASLIGAEGSNHTFYSCVATPAFKTSWTRAVSNAELCLQGNDDFTAAFRWFMNSTAQDHRHATVSGSIFNPLNVILGLWQWITTHDDRALPSLELFRDSDGGTPIHLLEGVVAWDGLTKPDDPVTILRECAEQEFGPGFGESAEAYFFAVSFHEAWRMEPAVMERHGLFYLFAETTFLDGKISATRKIRHSGDGVMSPVSARSRLKPLGDFVTENRDYLRSLAELLNTHFPFQFAGGLDQKDS